MKLETFTLNFASQRYTKGDSLKLKVDEHGTPLDKFWRRRLKDQGILKQNGQQVGKEVKKLNASKKD